MKLDSHERARQLIVAVRIEEIGSAERDWLQDHLASCRECSKEAEALDTAIGSFHALSVSASPGLASRTSRIVRRRSEQMEAERPHAAPLWIATALSAICMVVTAPYMWRAFGWFGQIADIPDSLWQVGFMVWWFVPATVLAVAAAWKETTNWGHQ